MKRTIEFKDKDHSKWEIECEIKDGRFSMSGKSGQCQDRIKPKGKNQKKLIQIWNDWHLNDLNAGTPKQSAAIEKWKAKGNRYDYTNACIILAHLDPKGKPIDPIESLVITSGVEVFTKEIKAHKSKVTMVEQLNANNLDYSWIKIPHDLRKYAEACASKNDCSERGTKYLWIFINYNNNLNVLKAKMINLINKEIDALEEQKKEGALQILLYDIHPVTGKLFEYGNGWLTRELPENFEEELDELLDAIEEEEEDKKEEPVTEADYELFKDFEEPRIAQALAIMLDLCVNEIDDIEEEGDNRWTVQGTDYYAGTDEEMNELAKEYMAESLWAFNASFLENYGAFANMNGSTVAMILKPLQEQCESGNEAIKELIGWNDNADEFVEAACSADGRGHFLNHYDGSELNVVINGITYYACQN